jgi:hypothetical protein
VTDRLIRITTALAVVVAAIISYQHAYELVRSHGECGTTARLLPFTVDGLIWAASMVVLDASRRNQPGPRLAAFSLGAGIVATVGANLAHGIGHGPIGTLVSAWPALALVGSFELLMMLVRIGHGAGTGGAEPGLYRHPAPPLVQDAPRGWRLRHPWKQVSGTGTKRATASALSPEISTSTDARSSGLSTNRASHFEIAAKREGVRQPGPQPAPQLIISPGPLPGW